MHVWLVSTIVAWHRSLRKRARARPHTQLHGPRSKYGGSSTINVHRYFIRLCCFLPL